MVIYGRGRHRTLAIYKRGRAGAKVLAKTHYSKATADEAAETVARALTLDGDLPMGMRRPMNLTDVARLAKEYGLVVTTHHRAS